ncbi:MAG: hypothetical protein IT539_10725 [Bradyrhizobiaceae bacterium]|nr:hypothetical protein [Bradyrhizobiaceae bacterium]
MAYRVYSGPAGADTPSRIERVGGLYKEFERLDDALSFARHLHDKNRIALLIEGDDGTRMDRREIAATLRHPEQDIFESRRPG